MALAIIIEPLRWLQGRFMRRSSPAFMKWRMATGRMPPCLEMVTEYASPAQRVLEYYSELLHADGEAPRLKLMYMRDGDDDY